MRKAISLGGDSDTMGCIVGGIAQAFYKGVPEDIGKNTKSFLPETMQDILNKFVKRFNVI